MNAISAKGLAQRFLQLRRSAAIRNAFSNSAFGALDYVAQPLLMLAAAPFLVRALGLQQYGLWMLVTAVIGSMGVLSSGFGDATLKYVSGYRGCGDKLGIARTIRATLTVNLVLGAVAGAAVCLVAPLAALHIFKIEPSYHDAAIQALRISGVIMFVRAIEVVFASTLRAFEQYHRTVRINVANRVATMIAAVVLAWLHHGVVAILGATLIIGFACLVWHIRAVFVVVGPFRCLPSFNRLAVNEVFGFGCFSWLQAAAAITFSQADKLLVGVFLGTSAVAYYTICVQVAQAVHGLIAAGFNFIFPHLSSRHEAGKLADSGRVFWTGMTANLIVTGAMAVPLLLGARFLLTVWMGAPFADQTYKVLTVLIIGSAVLAINVVPHYTLMAVGQVRWVSMVNVLGGCLALASAIFLIPAFGLMGAALSRLLYGPAVCLNFVRIRTTLAWVMRPPVKPTPEPVSSV